MSDSGANENLLPYPVKAQDTIFFLHIPKTAGTTLTRILQGYCKPAEFYSADPIYKHLREKNADELAGIRILRTHHGYNLYQFLPRKPIYITMLRNPVDQVISHYNHLARFGNEVSSETTLLDFVTKPRKNGRIVNNLQTYMISAGDEQTIRRDEHPFKQYSQQDILDLAKIHLHEFAWVGLQERFEESIQLLAHRFAWEPLTKYKTYNVTPSKAKADVSSEVWDIIAEHNQLDFALYEYAEQLFESRIESITELSR